MGSYALRRCRLPALPALLPMGLQVFFKGIIVKSKVLNQVMLAAAVGALLGACDGKDGRDGAAGARGLSSVIAQTVLPRGDANCAAGGTRVDSGIDDNGNGVLDSGEIDASNFVCAPGAGKVIDIPRVQLLLETNANIARSIYLDSIDTARDLSAAIERFAANRTQANLDAAKRAWLVAREPYGQSEVYRFRLSPIDSTDYATENGPEGAINAWPLGEALIDYVVTSAGTLDDFETDQVGITKSSTPIANGGALDGTDPTVNIINSRIPITRELIANTATADDERDVVAGYHAIEFLLWGQDLNNNRMVTVGSDRETAVKTFDAPNLARGGQRPLTDFTTERNANRRIRYLQVAMAKLIADLESVAAGWADGVEGNYRDRFTRVPSERQAKKRLAEILTGMGTLSEGELAGERMQIAFSANSQEDEHSCFSDNTHRDILLNHVGIANSFYGDYRGYDANLDGVATGNNTQRAISGYGFDDYAADLGIAELSTIASALDAALQVTTADVRAIDAAARAGAPVDVLIQNARRNESNPMYKSILSLNKQSAEIARLAKALEIDAKVVDDDATGCNTTRPDQTCG